MLEKKLKVIIGLLVILNLVAGGSIWYLVRLLKIQVPQIFVVMPYQPANITIEANNLKGPIKPFWLGFAQGGEEMGNMLSPTISRMRSLSPSYIRLDHIYDDDYYGVVSGSSGNLHFDWSRLDKEIEAIQAMGAKPFFSLGYMPGALAKNKIDVPYNWGDWQALVRATVEHYSGRGGKNISGVYYEVWNEPDLELFGKWRRSGEKNYLTLYENAVRGAMSASGVQPFYIGGPATTALYRSWVVDLYNFAASRGLRLDFISWHRYSYNPSQYSSDVASVYTWLSGKKIPKLVISEWGPTPEKSTSYAGSYASAHAVATVREVLDLVDLMTAFEVKDGVGQGDSGWGLLRHQSVGMAPKSRFWAFSWLAQAGGERVFLTGEGSNVRGWAVKQGNKIMTLLVNFGQGSQSEQVPITVVDLEQGEWQVTREVLGGTKSEMRVMIGADGKLVTVLNLQPNNLGRLILEPIKLIPVQAQEQPGKVSSASASPAVIPSPSPEPEATTLPSVSASPLELNTQQEELFSIPPREESAPSPFWQQVPGIIQNINP
jgi:hypothetical protein